MLDKMLLLVTQSTNTVDQVISYGGFILTIVGLILTMVGLGLTIKSNKLLKKIKTVEWNDINNAAKMVVKTLEKEYPYFHADFIISPGQRGGIFAHQIISYFDKEIPILCGTTLSKSTNIQELNNSDEFIFMETSKWYVALPYIIKKWNSKSVLLVDDFSMMGDFMTALRKKLYEYGYKKENVKSCSIVATTISINGKKAPDIYWKVIENDDFYFPWGKAI